MHGFLHLQKFGNAYSPQWLTFKTFAVRLSSVQQLGYFVGSLIIIIIMVGRAQAV